MLVRHGSIEAISFEGLRISDYTAGSESGASLALIEVAPGVTHPEAWSRRSDKYYLVVSGEVQFSLDGEAFALGPKDFCLVGQGKRFSYQNDGSAPALLVLVHSPSFDLESEVFSRDSNPDP